MSSLTDLVSQLKLYTESDSHQNVYAVSKKVLSKDPSDFEAQKQCLVALINMDRYQTALHLISKYAQDITKEQSLDPLFLLEKAYIYYKTCDQEQLEDLAPLAGNLRGFRHILAQSYYRGGQTEKALELYNNLLKNAGEEEADIRVNQRAVQSQLKFEDEYAPVEINQQDLNGSYDLLSNDALVRIREHRYGEALELLEKALETAKASLQDYEEESRDAELIPIEVQIAFVKQMTGNTDEALQILRKFDVSKLKDKALRHLVINNIASLRISLETPEKFNPTLIYRELGLPDSAVRIKDRLTVCQLRALQRNEIVLTSLIGKNLKYKGRVHAKKFAGSSLGAALTRLAKTHVDPDDVLFNETYKLLSKTAAKHPENVPFNVFVAQVDISEGKLDRAANLLEGVVNANAKILTSNSSLAVGPLLYRLYEKLGRKKPMLKLLDQLYNILIDKDAVSNSEEVKLGKFVGIELLSVDSKKSHDLLEHVSKLLSAYTHNSSRDSLIEAMTDGSTEDLPTISSLTKGIDTDELVKRGLEPLLSEELKGIAGKKVSAHLVKSSSNKRHRSKPRRLPKVLGDKIDEERWLPLKDRSYYRQKRRHGNKTQGGIADESLNISEKEKPAQKTTSSRKNKKKNRRRKGRK